MPPKKQWHKSNKQYLFNEFALAKVWRARVIAAISHSTELTMPADMPKKWVVDCRQVGFGASAFKYLSRYLYRGVLPDKDIISITDDNVTFRYKEGGTNIIKMRTLPVLKFLWLILQHVLPKGLQRVRDYGFLRGNAKQLRLQIMLILGCDLSTVAITPKRKWSVCICPCCQHEMHFIGVNRLGN
nr:transposase [Psychromonas antarctica]